MQCWVLHPNTAIIDVILKYIPVSIIYSDLYKQELVIIVQVYIMYIYTSGYVHGQYIIKICV